MALRYIRPCDICSTVFASSMAKCCRPPAVTMVSSDFANVASCARSAGGAANSIRARSAAARARRRVALMGTRHDSRIRPAGGGAFDAATDEEETDTIGDELARPPGAVNHRRAHIRAIDRLWQLAIAAAYQLLRLWWLVRRPAHRGALVALWHDGEILLLRSSYRPGWSLPGGGLARGESAREAA